jgi:saccharopine dehydrogenase (NAD+, L-lysine forming)
MFYFLSHDGDSRHSLGGLVVLRFSGTVVEWRCSHSKGRVEMRILLIGAGGVGGAFAAIIARRNFVSHLIVADVSLEKAEAVARHAASENLKIYAEAVDASHTESVYNLAKKYSADAIVNLCAPLFNPPIFAAAFQAGCTYLDTACNLSQPHPLEPYSKMGVTLGVDQFAQFEAWKERGILALTGMGVEPGLSDVFARYASDHLFSSIDEIGVRDGSDLVVEGYAFAPTFNIWTTIEECLNPPIIFERERGWFTSEPFSESETFVFPEGIGALQCVNVEHEEVLFIPRHIDVGRVTFKYGLGEEFIDVLKTLHKLGLDSSKKIKVGNVEISPRDLVAATLPDPAKLGDRMHGKTCAGTWVKGIGKNGEARETYLFHVIDNAKTMREYGCQAVVWQTAMNPAIALELIDNGAWSGAGVFCPEAFDSLPYLELLAAYGVPHKLEERVPGTGLVLPQGTIQADLSQIWNQE